MARASFGWSPTGRSPPERRETSPGGSREGVDIVVFASPSAVEGFLAAAGEAGREVRAAVIGPTTAEAARAAGLTVVAEADPSTLDGLADAIASALASPRGKA